MFQLNKNSPGYPGILVFALLLLLAACQSDYTPKPLAYFRIDLPKHTYQSFDTTYPYTFRFSQQATVLPKTDSLSEPFWININYPAFKGTIHLSYKTIDHDLTRYLEDARTLVMKHIPKANAINEVLVNRKNDRVFGMIYHIEGSEAASPVQFFLTDSSRHFVRAALYFWVKPNNDSLQPVIDFIIHDIDTLVGSLQWKNRATGNLNP